MCYAKPGPRCSRHAAQAVEKATAVYQQFPTMENLVALRSAESVYSGTPAGLKEIQERIDAEDDQVTKEALIHFHALKKAERQVFLDAYRFNQRMKKRGSSQEQALRQDSEGGKLTSVASVGDAKKAFNMRSEAFPTDLMPLDADSREAPLDRGISIVYDEYVCQETCFGSFCDDGYYEGLRIENFDSRGYLAYRFKVNEDQITDEMVAKLEAIDPKSHLHVEPKWVGYGADGAIVNNSDTFECRVREIFNEHASQRG